MQGISVEDASKAVTRTDQMGSLRLPVVLEDISVANMDRVSRYYLDYCKFSRCIGKVRVGSNNSSQ